jgi:hypothetical protein
MLKGEFDVHKTDSKVTENLKKVEDSLSVMRTKHKSKIDIISGLESKISLISSNLNRKNVELSSNILLTSQAKRN